MFEDTLSEERRGQVGIGTLIVFIALVLVAAVAAGVLINTAGELQSRASDTGDDAQAQVSNQIDVVSATGDAGTDDDGEVETVTLVVKKSPGSDPIDLNATTIQYTSPDTTKTLTYASGGASASEFTTNQVGSGPDTILDDTSERVEIVIDAEAVEGGSTGLEKGARAQIEIVDQSGAKTTYGVNVPEVITDQFVSV